jgi:hypothetical protein
MPPKKRPVTVRVMIPVRASADEITNGRIGRDGNRVAVRTKWSGKVQLGTKHGHVEYKVTDCVAEVDVQHLGDFLAGVHGSYVHDEEA